MWIEPIFDRTYADVQAAKHNLTLPISAQSDEPLKGAFNFTDMARIACNIHHISQIFGGRVSSHTNWRLNQIIFEYDTQAIIDDIANLKKFIFSGPIGMTWNDFEAMFQSWDKLEAAEITWDYIEARMMYEVPDIPNPPELPINNFEKLNEIERIIFLIKPYTVELGKKYRRLNTFTLGGDLI